MDPARADARAVGLGQGRRHLGGKRPVRDQPQPSRRPEQAQTQVVAIQMQIQEPRQKVEPDIQLACVSGVVRLRPGLPVLRFNPGMIRPFLMAGRSTTWPAIAKGAGWGDATAPKIRES